MKFVVGAVSKGFLSPAEGADIGTSWKPIQKPWKSRTWRFGSRGSKRKCITLRSSNEILDIETFAAN
jgi:hypothetical protein